MNRCLLDVSVVAYFQEAMAKLGSLRTPSCFQGGIADSQELREGDIRLTVAAALHALMKLPPIAARMVRLQSLPAAGTPSPMVTPPCRKRRKPYHKVSCASNEKMKNKRSR
jgi:hypothetical protein